MKSDWLTSRRNPVDPKVRDSDGTHPTFIPFLKQKLTPKESGIYQQSQRGA